MPSTHAKTPPRATTIGLAGATLGPLLALALVATVQAQSPYHRTYGATIVVDTAFDGWVVTLPNERPPCTLRDAIRAANDNVAVGGCDSGEPAKYVSVAGRIGIERVDRIVFDLGPGTPSIRVRTPLPPITEPVAIDGGHGEPTRVELDGSGILSFGATPAYGLTLADSNSAVEHLVINGFSGAGLLLTVLGENGRPLPPPTAPEIEDPELPDGGFDPCGPKAYPGDEAPCPTAGGAGGVDVPDLGQGGGGHYIAGNLIGTDTTGTVAVGNGFGQADHGGIVVLSNANLIGGSGAGAGNVISGNWGQGILLGGTNNVVEGNAIGSDASGALDLHNHLDGIRVHGGQFGSDCTVRDNHIAFNTGAGVFGGSNACGIVENAIHGNGGLGIDMAEPGPSANDPSGWRTRPPNAPVLEDIETLLLARPPYFLTRVKGTLNYRAGGDLRIELFHSPACDPSDYGEGQRLVGSRIVAGNGLQSFRVDLPGLRYGPGVFTATATRLDAYGGPAVSSEFSNCL